MSRPEVKSAPCFGASPVRTDEDGEFAFVPSGRTHLLVESIPLKFGGAGEDTHFLTVRSLYDWGLLTSAGGIQFDALRLREAPTIVQLVDNQTGWGMEPLPLAAALSLLRLKGGEIVPGSNCHGYTFAGSSFWIDDEAAERLRGDSCFVETKREHAEIAVFRNRGKVVHSCRLMRSGPLVRYIGKAGIGAILGAESEVEAARGNRFSEVEYLKIALP